jgi:Txe/YoeB family toxin of Txe-Axe toxin-antitoxin module
LGQLIPKFTKRFFQTFQIHGLSPGSAEAKALHDTIRAIVSDVPPPGAQNYEVLIPPVKTAWARRVAGRNVWIVYNYTDTHILVSYVTRNPPAPL